jgi:hypothetical protein
MRVACPARRGLVGVIPEVRHWLCIPVTHVIGVIPTFYPMGACANLRTAAGKGGDAEQPGACFSGPSWHEAGANPAQGVRGHFFDGPFNLGRRGEF